MRERLIALCLLFVTQSAFAQEPKPGFGDLLDAYVDESVARRFGPLGYCSPRGQDVVFEQVDQRLSKIRTALVSRFGDQAVANADQLVIKNFDEAFGTVSFSGCKIGDAAFDRKNLKALKLRHFAALNTMEVRLGLNRR